VTEYLTKHLKEGSFVSANGFRGFSPWLLHFMHLDRTSWLQEGVVEERCSFHGGQDEEIVQGDFGPRTAFKGMPPVIYFLQLGLISQSFHK
jgi:hypothetical protein